MNDDEKLQEKILQEAEKIEKAEKRIEEQEKRILKSEQVVANTMQSQPFQELVQNGQTLKSFSYLRDIVTRRIAKHKFIYTLLISLGIVLVWRGLWETTESLITSSIISLIAGIILLWLVKKHTEIH